MYSSYKEYQLLIILLASISNTLSKKDELDIIPYLLIKVYIDRNKATYYFNNRVIL